MYPSSVSVNRKKLEVLLLASEWGSSHGGLSTMNREIAIHLAKHPEVAVSILVPNCSESDKIMASYHNITIVEAKQRPGYEPVDCLSFPPRNLVINIVIGHGVKLGKQAQVIRETHHCRWIQVVHTAPEELAMYKLYSGAISRGEEKHLTEVQLCEMADLVVAVGPKLSEAYSAYLSSCGKKVFNLTPGIFAELSNLKRSMATQSGTKFRVLVFGRGDSEDFELKGFDIAAQAVAALNDRSYHLIFVGAPSGTEEEVSQKLLKQGLDRSQLTVRKYLENRENLAKLFCEANLAIIPSRTEGFGLTALEALSASLPFLVSQNSGFGEALAKVPNGSPCVIHSDDPQLWAQAIKEVRQKSNETLLKDFQAVRLHYDEMYSWRKQCDELVEKMLTLAHENFNETMELTFREKMSLTSIRDQAKAHELWSSDLGPECATLHGKAEEAEFAARETPSKQSEQPTGLAVQDKWRKLIPPNDTLMLKTCILDGKVSLSPNQVEFRHPNWTVPRYVIVDVEREHSLTEYGELFVTSNKSGELSYTVDVQPMCMSAEEGTPSVLPSCEPEVKLISPGKRARGKKRQPARFSIPAEWRELLAPNETLMFKTRISCGKVSLDPNHVEYRHPNWTVPNYIIVNVERANRLTEEGELFIISTANGQLRHVVHQRIVFCAVPLD